MSSFPFALRLVPALVICVSTSSLFGCTHTGAVRAPGQDGILCVRVASSEDLRALPEVRVRMITSTGEIENLGQTNDDGDICLPKARLEQCLFLIFCQDAHFCGALQVRGTDLLAYSETYLELAPFAVQ